MIKSKALFFLFFLISLSAVAQQKGISASVIFNKLGRERITGIDKSIPRSESLIYTSLWQQRYNLSYFKSFDDSKTTWLFFVNAGFSTNTNENSSRVFVYKDTVRYSIFDATIKRNVAEIGATYRRQLFQNSNEKLRLGLGYTTTIMRRNKDILPNTSSSGFPVVLTKTGIDIRFEPYLSYEITPELYFDLSVFRLLGITTTIAKSVTNNPQGPLFTSSHIDFDAQLVSFRNIGIQAGFRYALQTEKAKKKKRK